jgi:hypothetical protein
MAPATGVLAADEPLQAARGEQAYRMHRWHRSLANNTLTQLVCDDGVDSFSQARR